MTLLVYACIAVANACVWSILAVLLGASTGRTLGFFALVFILSLCLMLFMGGANRTAYD